MLYFSCKGPIRLIHTSHLNSIDQDLKKTFSIYLAGLAKKPVYVFVCFVAIPSVQLKHAQFKIGNLLNKTRSKNLQCFPTAQREKNLGQKKPSGVSLQSSMDLLNFAGLQKCLDRSFKVAMALKKGEAKPDIQDVRKSRAISKHPFFRARDGMLLITI